MRKVKRIKNVLCVLLATIISLVSMTTVKADGEVAPYEDMENATLLQKECYDLDEDTMIEITTYEKSIPSFARSSWKTKTGTRTYRIINKKSNTVFVITLYTFGTNTLHSVVASVHCALFPLYACENRKRNGWHFFNKMCR